ncbi:MAG: malto-oligosyltrehalose trehalohydrolase [Nodosilinea sp.]
MDIGARFNNGCEFTVWAPLLEQVAVKILNHPIPPIPMTKDERGYWHASAPNLPAGTRYRYQLDGEAAWPDPASQFQPEGVHGPSEVVDHSQFSWQDGGWAGITLNNYIIYELHVGTFTPEGTFAAAIARLPDLAELGVTAVEIMPVAQFPGQRNWGYDGSFPFAVQNSYGGPEGLKHLVNACHHHGLAVIMDVVYNHFGPEGNYSGKFGPYTTDRYRTPWGSAINFDDAYSDGVRNYFIQNALTWLRDYHIDALRLDAVHAIYDFGARHFLQALAEAVADFASQRPYPAHLIAESDLNDPRLIRRFDQGGYQLDCQWHDDFHHALHNRLTGDAMGYYGDFDSMETLATAIKNRFVYAGQYSHFRHRDHGAPALDSPSQRFVVCSQNHDQIGNRMMGDRLSTRISFEALKLSAGATLLSPYIPLLFMGEEYGDPAPFLYFVDHGDGDLLEAVRLGRREEFSDFHSDVEPPDPGSLATFKDCILNWLPAGPPAPDRVQQRILRQFYRRLIKVRNQCQIMAASFPEDFMVEHTEHTLWYRRTMAAGDLLCLMNFGPQPADIGISLDPKTWYQHINSAAAEWAVEGTSTDSLPLKLEVQSPAILRLEAHSIALYQAEPA